MIVKPEESEENTIECPNCHKQIEEGSSYCKYCGVELSVKLSDREKFEEEFRSRYRQTVKAKRKSYLITFSSMLILSLLLFISLYFGITKLNDYLNSEDYKIKSFLKDWENSWEGKDITKYKDLLDKDYIYYDRDGKAVKLDERIKRMQSSFETNKKINLRITNIKISYDSTSPNYANVIFKQIYTSDKKEETGTKTLRLYKGYENGNKWKIFREYFE